MKRNHPVAYFNREVSDVVSAEDGEYHFFYWIPREIWLEGERSERAQAGDLSRVKMLKFDLY
jgi:hypothetical protein